MGKIFDMSTGREETGVMICPGERDDSTHAQQKVDGRYLHDRVAALRLVPLEFARSEPSARRKGLDR